MDKRHGGPWDRGAADYYYRRSRRPHYYEAGSYTSRRIEQDEMTPAQVAEYQAGYNDAMDFGDQKDWGEEE